MNINDKCCNAFGCKGEMQTEINRLKRENQMLREQVNAHRLLGGYQPLPTPIRSKTNE